MGKWPRVKQDLLCQFSVLLDLTSEECCKCDIFFWSVIHVLPVEAPVMVMNWVVGCLVRWLVLINLNHKLRICPWSSFWHCQSSDWSATPHLNCKGSFCFPVWWLGRGHQFRFLLRGQRALKRRPCLQKAQAVAAPSTEEIYSLKESLFHLFQLASCVNLS